MHVHVQIPFCAERAARPKFNDVVHQVKEQVQFQLPSQIWHTPYDGVHKFVTGITVNVSLLRKESNTVRDAKNLCELHNLTITIVTE